MKRKREDEETNNSEQQKIIDDLNSTLTVTVLERNGTLEILNAFNAQDNRYMPIVEDFLDIISFNSDKKPIKIYLPANSLSDNVYNIIANSLWDVLVGLNLWRHSPFTLQASKALNYLIKKSNLVELNLSYTGMDDVTLQNIILNLDENKTLSILNISCNKISDPGVGSLSARLMHLDSLTQLHLQGNFITAIGAQSLAPALINKTLLEFYIYNNRIGNKGLEALSFLGGKDSLLKVLRFEDCNISKITNLISELKNNQSVLELNLRKNQIDAEGGVDIGSLLKTNKHIVEIDVSNNNLGRGIEDIGNSLKHNNTLKTLNIISNKLDDKALRAVASSLVQNKSLSTLYHNHTSESISENVETSNKIFSFISENKKIEEKVLNFIKNFNDFKFHDYLHAKFLRILIFQHEIKENKKPDIDNHEINTNKKIDIDNLILERTEFNNVPKSGTTKEDRELFLKYLISKIGVLKMYQATSEVSWKYLLADFCKTYGTHLQYYYGKKHELVKFMNFMLDVKNKKYIQTPSALESDDLKNKILSSAINIPDITKKNLEEFEKLDVPLWINETVFYINKLILENFTVLAGICKSIRNSPYSTLNMLDEYTLMHIFSFVGLNPSKKVTAHDNKSNLDQLVSTNNTKANYTQNNITFANSRGDDRNLADNGNDPHYWYSISDGCRLEWNLRQTILHYNNTFNTGEEYIAYRENTDRVFLADPYYITNFAEYLKDDIARISATEEFINLPSWNNMPTTIIIPLLSGNHWRVVKIDINYVLGSCFISLNDPYGSGGFSEELKTSIIDPIKTAVQVLLDKQALTSGTVNTIDEILISEDPTDQQGIGSNGWDCGPITFSNIKDYLKFVTGINNQLAFTIGASSEPHHAAKITSLRSTDIDIYSHITGISVNQQRVNDAKNALNQAGKDLIGQITGNADAELINKLASLNAFYLGVLFEALEGNRLLSGSLTKETYSYTELTEAYKAVEAELNPIQIISFGVDNLTLQTDMSADPMLIGNVLPD